MDKEQLKDLINANFDEEEIDINLTYAEEKKVELEVPVQAQRKKIIEGNLIEVEIYPIEKSI